MLRRLYIHNFRCLENFELSAGRLSSLLLIGNNGSGKTSVALALGIFQKIARGTNSVADLVQPKDLSRARSDVPMRCEIEVELPEGVFQYEIAFDLPRGAKQLRVLEEKLTFDGQPVYSRSLANVQIKRAGQERSGDFQIDWQLVALPILQQQSETDPLSVCKRWLSRLLILRPIPALIGGESKEGTLEPQIELSNLAAWWTGLLTYAPSAYTHLYDYLKQVMPDLKEIRNPEVGRDARSLEVHFSNQQTSSLRLLFEDLSDGEKCFVICALVLAANEAYGPLLCFWDEPDNYLAPSEVGHLVVALRKAFRSNGQLIATSHNPEAIQRFSDENTFVLYRKTHLEPTIIRPLSEMGIEGDLVGALIRGDVEP